MHRWLTMKASHLYLNKDIIHGSSVVSTGDLQEIFASAPKLRNRPKWGNKMAQSLRQAGVVQASANGHGPLRASSVICDTIDCD